VSAFGAPNSTPSRVLVVLDVFPAAFGRGQCIEFPSGSGSTWASTDQIFSLFSEYLPTPNHRVVPLSLTFFLRPVFLKVTLCSPFWLVEKE